MQQEYSQPVVVVMTAAPVAVLARRCARKLTAATALTAPRSSLSNLPPSDRVSKLSVPHASKPSNPSKSTTTIIMHVTSTTILAIAALVASATAASPDVKPVESAAPVDQQDHSISSLNATSSSTSFEKAPKGGYHPRHCLGPGNFATIKYACSWYHGSYYNQFFMRMDGTVEKRCICNSNLDQFKPWGPAWTYSYVNQVYCMSRDGRTDLGVQHEFDRIGC